MNSPVIQQALFKALTGCHVCGKVVRIKRHQSLACPRCHSTIHPRKTNSISTTWALLITAILLYIPANFLPIMTVTYFGSGQPDTIMSGVMHLLASGMWPLALVVFVASILVPVIKMLVLLYLLLSVQRKSNQRKRDRTRLFRITELVGRWSMVDVFVIALLTALVHLGAIATVEPGLGASAFAAVVVLTMFAAMRFDPRLIWDTQETLDGTK